MTNILQLSSLSFVSMKVKTYSGLFILYFILLTTSSYAQCNIDCSNNGGNGHLGNLFNITNTSSSDVTIKKLGQGGGVSRPGLKDITVYYNLQPYHLFLEKNGYYGFIKTSPVLLGSQNWLIK